MRQNETFKQMIEGFEPDLGDGDEYMRRLERRLAAVEAVKQMYETERRHTRVRLAVAFASGGVSGVLVAFYLLFHPLTLTLPSPQRQLPIAGWFAENAQTLATALLIAAVGICMAAIATQFYRIAAKDFT